MDLCAISKGQQSGSIKGETIITFKDFVTKFALATRKFKTIKAFARFKNKIWCMDLAFVDTLST